MSVNKDVVFATIDAIEHHKVRIVPAFDGGVRIAIVRDEAETVTKGGLHIPNAGQRKKAMGTIVAVSTGADESLVPLNRVSFAAYAGTVHAIPTVLGNVEVIVLHCSDIYLTWEAQEVAIQSWDATDDAQLTEEV